MSIIGCRDNNPQLFGGHGWSLCGPYFCRGLIKAVGQVSIPDNLPGTGSLTHSLIFDGQPELVLNEVKDLWLFAEHPRSVERHGAGPPFFPSYAKQSQGIRLAMHPSGASLGCRASSAL